MAADDPVLMLVGEIRGELRALRSTVDGLSDDVKTLVQNDSARRGGDAVRAEHTVEKHGSRGNLAVMAAGIIGGIATVLCEAVIKKMGYH